MRQGFQSMVVGAAAAALLGSTFVLAGASGCDNKRTKLSEEQSEMGLGLPDTHTDPKKKITWEAPCRLDQLVVEPAPDSPEAAVQKVLEAALDKGDQDAAFDKFYAQFDESIKEDWAKSQHWPRARKHAAKYLQGDETDGVTFKICQRDEKDDGSVKIFLQSLDPKKSNPPITLKKDDAGKWKVKQYTP